MTTEAPSETAIGVAARCWTEPTTEHSEMDSAVALVFAGKVDEYHGIIEAAWGIIANAGGGDWSKESEDWQWAAKAWRDRYHAMLDADLARPKAGR